MGNKVDEIYYIPTQEFCALDKNSKKQFFLKTIRPEVHEKLNLCIEEAMHIQEYNGKSPDKFLDNTAREIFDSNDLSLYIPVTVIKRKNEYCVCKDAFAHKDFVIPTDILYIKKDDYKIKSLYYMLIHSNYLCEHSNNMKCMMNLFYSELKHPKKEKIRKKKKDTK